MARPKPQLSPSNRHPAAGCARRIGLVSQIVLEQEPARFAVATVVNRIHELIVIFIVRAPFHSNRVAIVGAGHGGFKV